MVKTLDNIYRNDHVLLETRLGDDILYQTNAWKNLADTATIGSTLPIPSNTLKKSWVASNGNLYIISTDNWYYGFNTNGEQLFSLTIDDNFYSYFEPDGSLVYYARTSPTTIMRMSSKDQSVTSYKCIDFVMTDYATTFNGDYLYGSNIDDCWVYNAKDNNSFKLKVNAKVNFLFATTKYLYAYYSSGEIVKYDTSYNEVWACDTRSFWYDMYDSRSGGTIQTMAIDSNSNLYCLGNHKAFLKIDVNGNVLWNQTETPDTTNICSSCVDNQESLYIADGVFIIKYNPDMTQAWSVQVPSTAFSVNVDDTLTVYVGTATGIIRIDQKSSKEN